MSVTLVTHLIERRDPTVHTAGKQQARDRGGRECRKLSKGGGCLCRVVEAGEPSDTSEQYGGICSGHLIGQVTVTVIVQAETRKEIMDNACPSVVGMLMVWEVRADPIKQLHWPMKY